MNAKMVRLNTFVAMLKTKEINEDLKGEGEVISYTFIHNHRKNK